MKNLTVQILNNVPTFERSVEIVERKGTGHPDSICDSVMESVSVALSGYYLKEFGRVLHHNIDKALLVAGEVRLDFGGGEVVRPMELIIGDRATRSAMGRTIDVDRIAVETASKWFTENLPNVDPSKDLGIRVALRPGSPELVAIFSGDSPVLGAGDTSAAVGYAPMTITEKAVYDVERFLNSTEFRGEDPDTGEDVKVMGLRRGDTLDITVAMPLLAARIPNERRYFERKAEIRERLGEFLSERPFCSFNIHLNALDEPGRGKEGAYLSLLGTSAEDGDSGQVGRGNRINGVISLNRPMSTEAAAGKNPTSHVGKIYNILAHRAASAIYERLDGVSEIYVWLLSEIGSPVDSPKEASVEVVTSRNVDYNNVKRVTEAVLDEYFGNITAFTGELTRGEHPVC